jgi:hypothetical protein
LLAGAVVSGARLAVGVCFLAVVADARSVRSVVVVDGLDVGALAARFGLSGSLAAGGVIVASVSATG